MNIPDFEHIFDDQTSNLSMQEFLKWTPEKSKDFLGNAQVIISEDLWKDIANKVIVMDLESKNNKRVISEVLQLLKFEGDDLTVNYKLAIEKLQRLIK